MIECGIRYDFHCSCSHIAAAHWYVTGHGNVVSGRCHECPECKEFKADNLVHLEKLSETL
jgi:hypothetical protein